MRAPTPRKDQSRKKSCLWLGYSTRTCFHQQMQRTLQGIKVQAFTIPIIRCTQRDSPTYKEQDLLDLILQTGALISTSSVNYLLGSRYHWLHHPWLDQNHNNKLLAQGHARFWDELSGNWVTNTFQASWHHKNHVLALCNMHLFEEDASGKQARPRLPYWEH